MRNKTDNPLPETTQAPPASPEVASSAPLTFHPRGWTPLQDEVLQVVSLVGGKRELGLKIVNRDLRSGLLELALVAPDLTMTLFSRTDCERRTVHAPLNPVEGVRVEPYEAGHYYVRRAGLARLTSPATPAAPADRQLCAEGGSEPTAGAEESMPEPAPAVEPEPAPPSPQVEPEPVLPAEPRQVEPPPPPVSAPTVHRKNKRGRRAYDIWQPMFEHLDMCVKERGRPFETYKEAADYGQEYLEQLGEQRRKERKGKGKDKGAAIPTLQTIQEKISKQRPDLVIG